MTPLHTSPSISSHHPSSNVHTHPTSYPTPHIPLASDEVSLPACTPAKTVAPLTRGVVTRSGGGSDTARGDKPTWCAPRGCFLAVSPTVGWCGNTYTNMGRSRPPPSRGHTMLHPPSLHPSYSADDAGPPYLDPSPPSLAITRCMIFILSVLG